MVKLDPKEILRIARAVAEEEGLTWAALRPREQAQREREVVRTIKHFELERARA